MLYRISVAKRGLTGIANIFRSRLSGLDDLLRAGIVPLSSANLRKQAYSSALPSSLCEFFLVFPCWVVPGRDSISYAIPTSI